MNLILFGFKRCGKTFFGKLLAKKLHLPFIDTDRIIEHMYMQETGQKHTCREIAQKNGAPFFRNLENRAIMSLDGVQKTIISLGGGAILNPENAAFLEKLGQLVYLKADKATLKERLLAFELPSYLDPLDPEGSFEKMYQERVPIYEKIPAIQVKTDHKSEQQVIEELSSLLKK